MPRKLENYLRTYRKRAGLSQDEAAALLGCRSGAKMSRYERFSRRPGLEAAFACEVLFGVPSSEILAGVFEKVETATLDRARQFAERLRATSPERLHTLTWLQRLIPAEPKPQEHGLHTPQRITAAGH